MAVEEDMVSDDTVWASMISFYTLQRSEITCKKLNWSHHYCVIKTNKFIVSYHSEVVLKIAPFFCYCVQ